MLGLGNILTKGGALLGFPNKYSFSFDGSNDYLQIADNDSLSFGDGSSDSAFSISAWINPVEATRFSIASKATSSQVEWRFYCDDSDKLQLFLADNSIGVNEKRVSTASISQNTWTHVAVTYDGSGGTSASSGINLYINGSLDNGTADGFGTYVAMHNHPIPVNIGFDDYDDKYANGKIDEVAVWNVELSASTIAKLASKPLDLTKYSASNLKLWLRAGDKVLPEEDKSIARSDFYTDFDGADQRVLASNTGLTLSDFSVSGWFYYIDNSTTYEAIIALVDTGNDYSEGLVIQVFDNALRSEGASISGHLPIVSANTVGNGFLQNSWNHFSYTVDRDGGSGGIKLYINGTLASTGTAVDSATKANNIYIGAGYYSSAVQRFYKGYISNIAIHQTILDAQTIKQFAKSRYTPMRDNRFSVVDFDGTNDVIAMTTSSAVSPTEAITVSAWVNFTSLEDSDLVVGNTDTGSNGWRLAMDNADNIIFAINSWGSNHAETPMSSTGVWHHLVGTYDKSNIKIYLDGELKGTDSYTDSITYSSNVFQIGGASGWSNLTGSISSVAIYSDAKDADFIYAQYQKGITHNPSADTGLVGLWRMGSDTSKAYPTIADSSSNSNDGTITNGASDDIVQQMVAGYDMGAFESTEEELGGEKVDNNTSSAYGGGSESNIANVTNGVAITYAGTGTGLNATFSDASLLNTDIVASENKLHKLTFNAYYQGGSAGSKIRIYDQAVNHVTPSLTTTSASYSLYFRGRHASMIFQQVDMGSGNVVYITDMSFKEVLQSSDLSDTFPAIIDVNEPVLGAELFTNGWTNDGNGSSYPPYSGSFSYDASANSVTATSGSSGTYVTNETFRTEFTAVANAFYKITFTTSNTDSSVQLRGLSSANHLDTQTSTPYLAQSSLGSANQVFYLKASASATRYIGFRSGGANKSITVSNFSIKQVSGNVGLMTNQDSADLVYSSVLPDQSFLTGANSGYGFGSFDGTNDIVTASAVNKDYKSFSVWVKPTSTITKSSGSAPIGSFVSSGFGVIWIGAFASGDTDELVTIYNGTPRTVWENAGSASFPNDSWTHLALVWDGSKYQIYYNGQPQTTTTNSSHVSLQNNQSISIARGGSSRSEFFDGDISGVALWNKSLTDAEILSIYNNGRHSNLYTDFSDNLITYLAFGNSDATSGVEDTSSTIYDRSGNSNHGTVSGTTLQSPPNAEPNGYAKQDTNRTTTTP